MSRRCCCTGPCDLCQDKGRNEIAVQIAGMANSLSSLCDCVTLLNAIFVLAFVPGANVFSLSDCGGVPYPPALDAYDGAPACWWAFATEPFCEITGDVGTAFSLLLEVVQGSDDTYLIAFTLRPSNIGSWVWYTIFTPTEDQPFPFCNTVGLSLPDFATCSDSFLVPCDNSGVTITVNP